MRVRQIGRRPTPRRPRGRVGSPTEPVPAPVPVLLGRLGTVEPILRALEPVRDQGADRVGRVSDEDREIGFVAAAHGLEYEVRGILPAGRASDTDPDA
jgi:hypothetical protein